MKANIFANGVIERLDLIPPLIQPGEKILAVDGGAFYVKTLGLVPDMLIGDLDSINQDVLDWVASYEIPIKRFPVEKNKTDLELAIQEALHIGCVDLVVIGALGGRFDQALGNLALLIAFVAQQAHIAFDDGLERVDIIHSELVLHGAVGDRVSLLPVCNPVEGIQTTGLRYPLHDEMLYPQKTRGISNRMESSTATIKIRSGELLCIHTRLHLGKENGGKHA